MVAVLCHPPLHSLQGCEHQQCVVFKYFCTGPKTGRRGWLDGVGGGGAAAWGEVRKFLKLALKNVRNLTFFVPLMGVQILLEGTVSLLPKCLLP